MIASAALLLARAVLAAALVCIAFWVLYYGSRFYSDDSYWIKSDNHPVYGCEDALLAVTCKAQKVLHEHILFLWLAPTVMALAAVVVLSLQPVAGKTHHNYYAHAWLQKLLPPRSFWLYWCDGLTIQDLLIVIFWAAANAIWMSAIMIRSKINLTYRLQRFGLTQPTPSIMSKVVARAFGSLLIPNLVMLFYPVSRGSVVLQALGISYPAAIRYHRWLGQAVLTFVLLHGGMYWSAFAYDGTWVESALSQDDDVNHLMGSIAFVFALALWLTAVDVVRRRSYTVFKIMHHVGFWGFLVLGVCHYWGLLWSFLPGLMLYAVDGVYRLHCNAFGGGTTAAVDTAGAAANARPDKAMHAQNASNAAAVKVLHADVSPDGGMCSLIVHCPHFAAAANGFVWLCIPELSWFAYHPFTYVAVPWRIQQQQQQQQVMALLIHIKGYNRWTKKLVALLAARGCNIRLKVQGPYAEHPGPVVTYKQQQQQQQQINVMGSDGKESNTAEKLPDGLVIIAGGNGVTEAFSTFQDIWATRNSHKPSAASPSASHPARESHSSDKSKQFDDVSKMQDQEVPMLLIWTCRNVGEFEFLGPRVLAMAAAAGVNLTIKLFYTGKVPLPEHNAARSLSADPVIAIKPAAAAAGSTTTAAAAAASSHTDAAVMSTSNLCPVVALSSYWGTVSYKMIMHLVMFVGAFCAILVAKYITAMQPDSPMPTHRMGAIHLALIISFMLVPGFIVLWIALLTSKRQIYLRQQQQRGQDGSSSSSRNTDLEAPAAEMVITDDDDYDDHKYTRSRSEIIDPATAVAQLAAEGVSGKMLATAAAAAAGGGGKDNATGLQLLLPATNKVSRDDSNSSKVSGSTATLSTSSISLHVAAGRPDLRAVVSGWLLSQSTAAAAAAGGTLKFTVYAMGPPVLVKSVKILCDDLNFTADSDHDHHDHHAKSDDQQIRGKQSVKLFFVRKTHDL